MDIVGYVHCEFVHHVYDGPIDSGQKRVGGWITLTADVFLLQSWSSESEMAPGITPGVRWPR